MKRLLVFLSLVLLFSASVFAADDVYKKVFDSVSSINLQTQLKNMSGVNPVTVGSDTFTISDRYQPTSKMKFREYWTAYFEALGIPVKEIPYDTQHTIGESQGHNLEAVLPGKSADSIVIIVHYDSMGPTGQETSNPAADDDMTGMSVMMETARILTQYKGNLNHTIRFVAADYEEWAYPGLEGARQYAKYIQNLSATQNFKIVAGVDDEQSGWNCFKDQSCFDSTQGDTFDVFSCSGDSKNFNYPAIGDALAATATTYSKMKVNRDCIGQNSDHYALWEIGVPSVVFSEHLPFNNPHFDSEGGDTYDKIDLDYFFHIAQVGVTFATQLVGISQ